MKTLKKMSLLVACIGMFSAGAFAQQPAKAKSVQDPVKVAPAAKAAPAATVSRVEPAPKATTTSATAKPAVQAKSFKKEKIKKREASKTVAPVERNEQK